MEIYGNMIAWLAYSSSEKVFCKFEFGNIYHAAITLFTRFKIKNQWSWGYYLEMFINVQSYINIQDYK